MYSPAVDNFCDCLSLSALPFIVKLYGYLNKFTVSEVCVSVVASPCLSCLLDYIVVAPIFSPAHREDRKFSNTNVGLDITLHSP